LEVRKQSQLLQKTTHAILKEQIAKVSKKKRRKEVQSLKAEEMTPFSSSIILPLPKLEHSGHFMELIRELKPSTNFKHLLL